MKKSLVTTIALVFGLVSMMGTATAKPLKKKLKIKNFKLDVKQFNLPDLKKLKLFPLKARCGKFRRAETKAALARALYIKRYRHCLRKSFSIADQRKAGCKSNDTLARCNFKLMMWCTRNARKRYFKARVALRRAATDLINFIKSRVRRYNIVIR